MGPRASEIGEGCSARMRAGMHYSAHSVKRAQGLGEVGLDPRRRAQEQVRLLFFLSLFSFLIQILFSIFQIQLQIYFWTFKLKLYAQ